MPEDCEKDVDKWDEFWKGSVDSCGGPAELIEDELK
jgi:hypothetical protein